MQDLYMAVLLAVTYLLFYGFLSWCSRVVEETGGERR